MIRLLRNGRHGVSGFQRFLLHLFFLGHGGFFVLFRLFRRRISAGSFAVRGSRISADGPTSTLAFLLLVIVGIFVVFVAALVGRPALVAAVSGQLVGLGT